MDKNFAIIDLETTGGAAKREKIIEIAIVVFDGKKIIDSFDSLINPERSIPSFITRITGITDDMVINAPKFYEVAKKVIEITNDCIFVAHNSRFDYSFIQEEFNSLGFTYTRKQLCTVKLFRRLFPGLKSYSLGNLIKEFDITVDSRHRAMADVIATLDILKLGLKIPNSESVLLNTFGITIKESKLPPGINYSDISELPEQIGIYYFKDMFDNIMYIGKSINIKKRVKQHFQKITPKSNKFYNTVRKIDYKITGSELVALLKEAEEIKTHKPPINKALRKDKFPYSLYYEKNNNGYLTFKIKKSNNYNENFLSGFTTRKAAKSHIEHLVIKHNLCINIANNYNGVCFEYGIGRCNGACIGKESLDEYNLKMWEIIEDNRGFETDNFLIIEKGRDKNESAIILIENQNYVGFSYINNGDLDISDVRDTIIKKQYDKDFNQIIKSYINTNPVDIREI